MKHVAEKRSEKVFKPEYFVTGGEVGADSIPLECCKELGIETMGYMPKGFKRSDGRGKEIADEYNLTEGEGSYPWRDEANANSSDAIIAFLTSKPMTGKGTMQTLSVFIRGWYRMEDKSWDPVPMPDMTHPHSLYLPYATDKSFHSLKPALVIWDLSASNIDDYAPLVRQFLITVKPAKLMFSGPTLATEPDITTNGADLMRKVFQ